MPLITQSDIRFQEQTLYKVVLEELIARQVLRVNTNYNKTSPSITYKYYEPSGKAKILANGAGAKDVNFVGEDGKTNTVLVRDIGIGIRYTRKELEDARMTGTNSNGATVRLDMIRMEAARRAIAETENQLTFIGDPTLDINGLVNVTGNTSEDVAQGALGANATEKRQWLFKTPKEILKDLMKAKTASRQKGKFRPDTLVLPPNQFDMLDQPYGDNTTMTIRSWLGSQGVNFPKVYASSYMTSAFNGLGADCLLVLDSSPMVAEIAVPSELELLDPVYDLARNSEQMAIESLVPIVRYPSAIYVGKGI